MFLGEVDKRHTNFSLSLSSHYDQAKVNMVLCTGCHRSFASSGYVMHVRNTTNRDCHIGYQHGLQLAGFYDIRDEDNGLQDQVGALDDFEGDLFGKYDEGNFEWPDDDDNSMCFSLSRL